MCDYCGCRDFPVISRLSREHFEIKEAAGAVGRAMTAGTPDVPVLLDRLVDLVDRHTSFEERSLFTELRRNTDFHDAVEALCAEHVDLHTRLHRLHGGPEARASLDAAVDRLLRHIDKEENGIFPAAAVLLDMPAWDRVTAMA